MTPVCSECKRVDNNPETADKLCGVQIGSKKTSGPTYSWFGVFLGYGEKDVPVFCQGTMQLTDKEKTLVKQKARVEAKDQQGRARQAKVQREKTAQKFRALERQGVKALERSQRNTGRGNKQHSRR